MYNPSEHIVKRKKGNYKKINKDSTCDGFTRWIKQQGSEIVWILEQCESDVKDGSTGADLEVLHTNLEESEPFIKGSNVIIEKP